MSNNSSGAAVITAAAPIKRDWLGCVMRISIIAMIICLFIPALNPTRMSALISDGSSFFTTGVSYGGLTAGFGRAIKKAWIEESVLMSVYAASLVVCIGIAVAAVGCALTLGEKRLKRLGALISVGGCGVGIIGMIVLTAQYPGFENAANPAKIQASFPFGIYVFFGMLILCAVLSAAYFFSVPKPAEGEGYVMLPKFRLFLMMVPFIILIFLFSYLPLWGWRYAFFDYIPGTELSSENFVGFKWFTYLFQNSATRSDILRVLTNTLAMSGLGILTSWMPMAFAVFLSEIKNGPVRRAVQTLTTIPNFISWVLVYTFAFALFSTEGFVNTFLMELNLTDTPVDFLMGNDNIWLKMLGWNLWKTLGWNAIIYIAAISGIDQQLYEAATIDGAGRFRKIWHITIPGLMPTFFVLLLLSIAGILSNGMDQYLVFKNATNKAAIEVLDLYVYNLGLGGSGSGGLGQIPLSTVVSMIKSIVSVVLLFIANRASKAARGESIV
ncbi:MAG: ABC transporter permease subunit [Ruminiclostridium sp.]